MYIIILYIAKFEFNDIHIYINNKDYILIIHYLFYNENRFYAETVQLLTYWL